jgi:hypothetical protein
MPTLSIAKRAGVQRPRPGAPTALLAASLMMMLAALAAAGTSAAAAPLLGAPRRTAGSRLPPPSSSSSGAADNTNGGGSGGGKRRAKDLLHPTSSGYLTASEENGSELFYVFFEAEEPDGPIETTPIVMWLQVGALT